MLKDWLREKYRVGDLTEKQLQVFHEAVGLSRTLVLRWIYDDYEPAPEVLDKMLTEAHTLGYRA